MQKETIQFTDKLYDALKTIGYAIKNDVENQFPMPEMAKIHYKIACESLRDALAEQEIELPC